MNNLIAGRMVIDQHIAPPTKHVGSTATVDCAPGHFTALMNDAHHRSLGRLVALASSAIVNDPRSAKAYLQEAAALLDGEPAPAARATPKGGTLTRWQVRRIKEYIDLNIEGPIRNHDLSRVARLSVSYLSRAFKLTTGQSLHRYVLDQRVRHAKLLMTQSTDRLSEIACACGFADQAHLSRMFKRNVGESPTLWRRTRERAHSGSQAREHVLF